MRYVRKHTLWQVHPAKTQISLHIRIVWSESSLYARRNFSSLAIQDAPSYDSKQTTRMHRLTLWKQAYSNILKILPQKKMKISR